jgi:hypothetical protein
MSGFGSAPISGHAASQPPSRETPLTILSRGHGVLQRLRIGKVVFIIFCLVCMWMALIIPSEIARQVLNKTEGIEGFQRAELILHAAEGNPYRSEACTGTAN